MRANVTCECCGHRQAVARQIREPETFHIVCHGCEGILRVDVTMDDLVTAGVDGATPALTRLTSDLR